MGLQQITMQGLTLPSITAAENHTFMLTVDKQTERHMDTQKEI